MSEDGVDEPGGAGKALGDMSEEEIAAVRAAEEEEASGGKAEDGNVHPIGNGRRGRSVSERAEDGPDDEEENEALELFPEGVIDADPRVTLKNLIKAGFKDKIEMEVSLMSASVPLRGGIPDPEEIHRMVVSTELGPVNLIPQRKGQTGDRKLEGWKIRANLRPTYVEPADTDSLLDRMLVSLVAEEPPDVVKAAAADIMKYIEERSAAA